MECPCGNQKAYAMKMGGSGVWECNECGGASQAHYADVFWNGKPVENLCDPVSGKPLEFISRGHKAKYMKERGITEAGDRVHGAPYSSLETSQTTSREKSREQVREAIQKVRQMSASQRRDAIQKIVGRRYG